MYVVRSSVVRDVRGVSCGVVLGSLLFIFFIEAAEVVGNNADVDRCFQPGLHVSLTNN